MSIETLSSEPYFFGKNSFVPFIGSVEDVDDPKRSNRVRVRCLGWHEGQGEDQPKTEDLPWAKVCMPTTHAQQGRIGGKHGLLVGCWVFGFFMDGLDAQDPYVLNTFNFTSKVLKENNRTIVDTSKGKLPEGSIPKDKIMPGESQSTAAARRTAKETNAAQEPTDETDAAGDLPLDSSTNGKCPTTPALTDKVRLEEPKSTGAKGNPEGQKYKAGLADGICGPIVGAREEIQNIMEQLFPPEVSRFAYGDQVWNIFSGNHIDMNGILQLIAQFISSQLKFSVNTMKAFQEDTIMRPAKALTILSIPDRDGVLREVADFTSSVASDNFNAVIDKIVSELAPKILGVLQELNNGSEEDNRQLSDDQAGGDNRNNNQSKGNVGAKSSTPINNSSALSLTDELLEIVGVEIDSDITDAVKTAIDTQSQIESNLQNIGDNIQSYNTFSSRCDTDINIKMTEISDSIGSQNQGGGGDSGLDIGGLLGDASQYLQMALSLKFILSPQVFNKSGFAVLDELNSAMECVSSATRMFETAVGKLGSISGVDFTNGITGGGSNSGRSSKITKNIQQNIGFGGLPLSNITKRPGEAPVLSEDARTKRVKDKEVRRESQPEWESVDFHEIGRVYTLKGEERFGSVRSNNSRILVTSQEDPTENGIYLSSASEWSRTSDASTPRDFTKYKIVKVRGKKERTERWWFYNLKDNPKLGSNTLSFEPLYVTPGYRPVSKIKDVIKNIKLEDIQEIVEEDTFTLLNGKNATALPISLPSGDPVAADNFVQGITNQIVITDPGVNYYNKNYQDSDFQITPNQSNLDESGGNIFPANENSFPSIFIPKYEGTPVPVVDPKTGEIVAILTNFNSFSQKTKNVSIIKDNSNIGIRSDDINYDITIGGIFVANIGNNYTSNTVIEVIDRDTNEVNGILRPVIVEGRIVDAEIINSGTGFQRIPEVSIIDTLGVGAKLYPIMNIVPRNPNTQSIKPIAESVNMIFCSAKNQRNLVRPGRR